VKSGEVNRGPPPKRRNKKQKNVVMVVVTKTREFTKVKHERDKEATD